MSSKPELQDLFYEWSFYYRADLMIIHIHFWTIINFVEQQ